MMMGNQTALYCWRPGCRGDEGAVGRRFRLRRRLVELL